MESFCDSTTNFISNKPYKQIVLGSSITEDEARKRCVKHTYKNRDYEGKDFFYQQHHGGHTICGFFDDKIDDSDEKQNHGHVFGGICTIPEDVEIKLHVDEKVNFVTDGVKRNVQQINFVKTKNTNNTSEIESIKARLDALEDLSKNLQDADINMSKSIKGLETADEKIFDSIDSLEQNDEKYLDMLSDLGTSTDKMSERIKKIKEVDTNTISAIRRLEAPQTCNMRKGWTKVGNLVNFKKNGQNGLEGGMTLNDCVEIGQQNGWNFVGHRNGKHGNKSHRNTCWRYDSNFRQNERLETWVRADGNDMVHTTVELKNNCSV